MSEHAEQMLEYAARNMHDPRRHSGTSRNPKVTMCPVCKKGIRAIAGEVRESLAMHMKAKGCEIPLVDAIK
jgi:hypothetical protein